MKYTSEIIIDLPRDRVVELFDSLENLFKWQKSLLNFEHVSGDPGKKGAKSRLTYEERGREINIIETIMIQNFPKEFTASYETNGTYNIVKNSFYETENGKTKWVMNNEFTFSSIMRIISILMQHW